MGEKKSKSSLEWTSIAAIVLPIVGFLVVASVGQVVQVDVLQTSFDTHITASEKHEDAQDKLITGTIEATTENRLQIARLGPAAQEAAVKRVIAQVQDEIDCKMISDNVSGWLCVSSASSDYLPDDLRVRVEEHFRKLGYEVSRQKQLPGGQWRGFWILVEQS